MKHVKPIALIIGISVLAGSVAYGAVLAVYRIAQAQSWSPAFTNASPLIALAAICLSIGPVTRVLKRRADRHQQSSARIGEVNAPQRTPTKHEVILKTGVLYWGGFMFFFFAIVGPLIPLFTTGKPLTMHDFTSGLFLSAIVSFPTGAIFGWLMWRNANRTRSPNG